MTRFSGVTSVPGQGGGTLAIDPQGIVGSILDLRGPGRAPDGSHWLNEPQRSPLRAQDVGQVFGVALDDANPPNIYVTSTSAFGLHRSPDNRDWARGMWGPGGPGAIYRLDASNGYRPQLFARVTVNGRPNTGAALGNIAYDRVNKQFFVSDLETGMIHRIGLDGSLRGMFDHGGRGRTAFQDVEGGQRQSLAPIAFPPNTRAQVQDCQPLTQGATFDMSPECWNFAPSGRRVGGLGVAQLGPTDVRLFYAVASGPAFGEEGWAKLSDEEKRNSVWSVAIGPDGDFQMDSVRREFVVPDFFVDEQDVARAGFSHPVTDITFPTCGTDRPAMLVAERGTVRNLGLGADKPFAAPHEARVIRYELDGSGAWQPIGRYDVGFYDRQREGPPLMRANCAGGVAFGPGYSENGWRADPNRPDQFVWMTGDSLCSPDGPCNGQSPLGGQSAGGQQPGAQPASQQGGEGEQGDDSEVHGVQGMPAAALDELVPGQGGAANGQQPQGGPQRQGAAPGAGLQAQAGQGAPGQGEADDGPPPAVGPSQAYLIDVDVNVDQRGPIAEELTRNDATMIGDIAIYQQCAPPAAGRPMYMVPPTAAPATAWPAWTRVHPTDISHARIASHGRRLSHYRFGSHAPDISHNRWQSHWPRISHDRRRSHHRRYSDGHLRPLSPGHTRRLSPGHRRPASPGHSRRLSPGHVRPLSPGHNRFVSPGHVRPLSPGHDRRASPGHRRPASPGHTRMLSPGGHSRAVSPGGHPRALSVAQRPGIVPAHRRGASPGVRPPPPTHVPAISRRAPRTTLPPRVGPGRVGRPGRVGPGRVGPGRVGPGRVGPGRVGPGRVGPGRVGRPGRVGPVRTGPGRVAPRVTPRRGAVPTRGGPGRAGTARSGPGRAGVGRAGAGRPAGRAPARGGDPRRRR